MERGTFTPLIFSATGGMSDEAHAFYKHLASLLSDKWTEQYSTVMGWLRCCSTEVCNKLLLGRFWELIQAGGWALLII